MLGDLSYRKLKYLILKSCKEKEKIIVCLKLKIWEN